MKCGGIIDTLTNLIDFPLSYMGYCIITSVHNDDLRKEYAFGI